MIKIVQSEIFIDHLGRMAPPHQDGASVYIRGLLEKYPTFGREKETGLLGALDT